jgi:hypothetical protein
MISCVGFLLRRGVKVSNLVIEVINIKFDLIMLPNNKNFMILSHCTMGEHNCP